MNALIKKQIIDNHVPIQIEKPEKYIILKEIRNKEIVTIKAELNKIWNEATIERISEDKY